MKHSQFWSVVVPTTLLTSILHGQDPDFSLVADTHNAQLGSAFASLGDLDGDGITDLAVADQSARVDDHLSSGLVYVISGADGTILRIHEGTPAPSQLFGFALASLDADGDGLPDLAVGATGHDGGAGAVWIYSGSDGSVLATTTGASASRYGSALANAGDQDGDGGDDLFVGAPFEAGNRGAVHVQSGSDGSVIRSHPADTSFSGFGSKVAALGDIDGDGLADLAVAAPGFRVGSNPAGRIRLVNSADGSIAAEAFGTADYSNLGDSMVAVPDADGDGLPDLMAGTYSGGDAWLLSGADLTTVADLGIPELAPFQPLVVGGSIDFDGDGVRDYLLGSQYLNHAISPYTGGVRITSGADQSTLFQLDSDTAFDGLGTSQRVLPGFGFAAGAPRSLDEASEGRGLARFWAVEEVEPVSDTDGDGVLDDADAVVDSIMTPSVEILGRDSRVENRVDGTGTTLADRWAELGEPGDYRRSVYYLLAGTRLVIELKCDDLVSKREARKLHKTLIRSYLLQRKRR